MNIRLADIGHAWTEMAAHTEAQIAALRHAAQRMAEALDEECRRAVEGARDWHRARGGRYE